MTHRIVEVVGSLAVGGAERVSVEIAAGLAARGWRASLLIAGREDAGGTPYEQSIRGEAEKRGVRVEQIGFRGVGDAAGRRALADVLRRERVDLVHVHNRPQDWQIAALCKLAGIPVLYTVHLPYTFSNVLQRAVYIAAGAIVPNVVCVSRAVANQVERSELVPARKLRVIYNGIRMEVFRPPSPAARAEKRAELGFSDDTFAWLCAARLHPQKGHAFLLEAMALLPKTSRARLILAGEGPLEAELRARHARLGLGERVTFLGPRRDVPALLGAVDGYATSTMQEGHPLSLLEAMAVELPVVAPRLPSIEEIAIDGAPVFFGPKLAGWATTHDPEAIASTLLAVEKDQRAYAERARATRDHVARTYSLDGMISAHAALYEEILARKAR